jgi:CSLREA domain-containing protein
MFSHSRIFPITLNILVSLFLLLGSALIVRPVYAVGITVNTTVDENNSGANCSLREAITAANTDAAYGGCTAGSGADTITFAANYTITLGSQLPAVTDTMIITGNGAANTIIQASADSNTATYRVFEVGLTGDLTLDGLTVRHGRCTTSACTTIFNTSGGGIINSGILTVKNSIISDNSASDNGGGIFNDGTLTVTDSTILNNSADNGGGILNNSNSDMTVSNSTFLDNSGFGGGAVYNYGGTLTMTNSTLNHNSATDGGGIYNSGTLNMTNIFFFDSTATNGGGIYNETTAVIANSTFQENTASANGSGIHNTGDLTLTNSTFSENFAASGGGIYNGGALAVNNSILANTADSVSDCTHAAGSLSGANNIIETTSTCSSVATITSDPNLGTPMNVNQGPPFFPLNPGSPAIDAGNDTICAAAPVNNESQNGVTRPQGSQCDIGSYEYQVYDTGSADVDVVMAGLPKGTYPVAENGQIQQSYSNLAAGPVKVTGNDNTIVMSERVLFSYAGKLESYYEMMALPVGQLNTEYWYPYNTNSGVNTQLRVANAGNATANFEVWIAGTQVTGSPFSVAANAVWAQNFYTITGGPVQVKGTNGVPITSTQRFIFTENGVIPTSFAETMGLPSAQLDTEYWFPIYNNQSTNSELRIANVGGSTATVDIYMGGVKRGETLSIPANSTQLVSFPGLAAGPVRIVSTGASPMPIVVTERVLFSYTNRLESYYEMMALPAAQLSTEYWYPYNTNSGVNTQLRVANAGNATANFEVWIAGTQVPGSPFSVAANAVWAQNFYTITGGPVQVKGTNDVPIVSTQRFIFTENGVIPASFAETMGLPLEQLSDEYWFPIYNNQSTNSELRIANP